MSGLSRKERLADRNARIQAAQQKRKEKKQPDTATVESFKTQYDKVSAHRKTLEERSLTLMQEGERLGLVFKHSYQEIGHFVGEDSVRMNRRWTSLQAEIQTADKRLRELDDQIHPEHKEERKRQMQRSQAMDLLFKRAREEDFIESMAYCVATDNMVGFEQAAKAAQFKASAIFSAVNIGLTLKHANSQ